MTKIDIKEEILKLEDQVYLRNHEREGLFVLKMLKHLKDIVSIDFGDEPKKFVEAEVSCEAWRAIRVLERIYTVDKNL